MHIIVGPVLAACGLVLAGCVNQSPSFVKPHTEMMDVCRATYPKVVGGMMRRVACFEAADRRYRPWSNQGDLIIATRARLAEQADRKEITIAEVDLRFAQAVNNAVAQEREQAALNAHADSARAATAIGLMNVMRPAPIYQLTPYFMPQQNSPVRLQTTCIPLGGGMMNCF